MEKGQVLRIFYDRITSTEEIALTTSNCANYGFEYGTKTDDVFKTGKTVTVFYEKGKTINDHISYTYDEKTGVFTTIYILETKASYSHMSPPCSSFKVSFADVDKEGSGRNASTGEMERERMGYYIRIDVTYDLIPNTKEYHNWYKVLTHLPPKFNIECYLPNGTWETIECYRADVSTDLYLFYDDGEIWKGLSTSFIQFDISEYDESVEPTLD